MVRLTRLKIDRFRNVKPGTDLRFGPTFNVLLGRNATGKSTLLDLIAAVTNDDLSAYALEYEGFDLTWRLEDGETEIELHASRTPVTAVPLPPGFREDKEYADSWTMEIRAARALIGRLKVLGARAAWTATTDGTFAFDVEARLGTAGAVRRALTAVLQEYVQRSTEAPTPIREAIKALTGVGAIGRFDEAVGMLDRITTSTFLLWRENGRSGGSFNPWLPTEFILAMDGVTPPESIVLPLNELGSLSRISELLGFASADLHPRMMQRSQEGKRTTTTYQGFDCLFRRPDGSQISHHLLSFGQKRLFAFLWYLAVRAHLPVVVDELLNGLHHEWIEICFERLQDRQSFLATQHPWLLDHIPIESAEAVRTTFVRCSIEADPSGREQMVWRNFDEEEADRFFVAYQTGIQHVSEILRTEGLW